MGKLLPEIGEPEAAFIASQKVFFVGTAPLSPDHRVNVSPKANGCVVLDKHTVVYADLTGSGAETAAHVLQNGRMTLMFCNLEAGAPRILRLFGRAQLILAEDVPESLLQKLPERMTKNEGFRAVYKLSVDRVTQSCGYSMPVMTFEKYRTTLDEWTQHKGPDGMNEYRTLKNSFSIDGLPSLALLRNDAPVDIVPVPEGGYILGKVQPGDKAKQLKVYRPPQTVRVRLRDLIFAGVSVALSGMVVGALLARWGAFSVD
ncbi:Pyridoxamine 5'-phosphate oxidase family protein ustO [Porphyridium purpureum]|uniref:Pyridoxamine 5'-phosphate oxidase family protein ustO n=1 Tax=Porphyridium purpureum TaxID=35688 RepID=A0A5J4YKD7_PORPP|nr:Pyridoxamine 5'-phosphate oxidase family protein ustO [Porphyridium purpureum]|eukprot:POR6140..scf246_12